MNKPVKAPASAARQQAQRKLLVRGGIIAVAVGAILFGVFTRAS